MNSTATGRRAEAKAATYLITKGYDIIAVNWRTKACEIDIIARSHALHFIEVKYRRTNITGAGMDYITPAKLRKMRFAAGLWLSQHKWDGEIVLGVIEVSGKDFEVTEFIPRLEP